MSTHATQNLLLPPIVFTRQSTSPVKQIILSTGSTTWSNWPVFPASIPSSTPSLFLYDPCCRHLDLFYHLAVSSRRGLQYGNK